MKAESTRETRGAGGDHTPLRMKLNDYFISRFDHQTTFLEAVADRVTPVELPCRLATVESALVENAI